MDIPDDITFRILEEALEEHDYSDNALWCDGPLCDNQWTIKKRTKTRQSSEDREQREMEEIVVGVSDNRGVH